MISSNIEEIDNRSAYEYIVSIHVTLSETRRKDDCDYFTNSFTHGGSSSSGLYRQTTVIFNKLDQSDIH